MVVAGAVYADKNHIKISREYSTIKHWSRGRDIPRTQKISDARTIKNRWLRGILPMSYAYKNKRLICH